MYLTLSKEDIDVSDLNELDHVESEDSIYVISNDAYNMANIWGKTVQRPMYKGLISADDIDALDVLTLMMEQLIGRSKGGNLMYSVPAVAVDIQNDITYHSGVFGRIFKELGYNAQPMNEALAIVYSELMDNNFTGLAISCGAGQQNICLAYKKNPVFSFSVARSGDYIDESVARSLGTVPTRVTSIKEKSLDLMNYRQGNKKERRVKEALAYYYKDTMRYVLDIVRKKLETELGDTELPESLPIVISGGTSMAKGYIELFKEIIEEYEDFPFEIKEIRHAEDPLTAVSEGLLIKAMSLENKL